MPAAKAPSAAHGMPSMSALSLTPGTPEWGNLGSGLERDDLVDDRRGVVDHAQ